MIALYRKDGTSLPIATLLIEGQPQQFALPMHSNVKGGDWLTENDVVGPV